MNIPVRRFMPLLYTVGFILSIPYFCSAANLRRVTSESIDAKDKSAINTNFDNVKNELSNVMHKTGTETVYGVKTFGDGIIGSISSATYSTTSGSGGIVIGSSVTGSGDWRILYVDSSGLLASTSAFKLDNGLNLIAESIGSYWIDTTFVYNPDNIIMLSGVVISTFSGDTGYPGTGGITMPYGVSAGTGTFSGDVNVGGNLYENSSHVFSGASMFESSTQSWSVNSLVSVSHGLGGVPRLFSAVLRCETAELGYSVGDEVIPYTGQNANESGGVFVNSTTIGYAVNDALLGTSKDAFEFCAFDPSKWKFVFRAWY